MKIRRLPMYETRPDGSKTKTLTAKFYACFQDFGGIKRRLPLDENRKAADTMGAKVDDLNSARAAGQTVLPLYLAEFVEAMPNDMRARLAEWGILNSARVAGSKPLSEHLDAWKAALLAKGNTADYAELTATRARKALEGFAFWSDISAAALQQRITGLRDDHKAADGETVKGIAPGTFNFYLKAAKQFCGWMVKERLAAENPLAHLPYLRIDKHETRRALAVEELRWLVDVTENGSLQAGIEPVTRFGMTGKARAMLYRLAVETGFRAGELRSLTRGSFQLKGEAPTVTIKAPSAKNRKADTLPLRQELAAALDAHLAAKMPNAQAFAVPAKTRVAKMFRADLADARRAWLAGFQNAQEREEASKGTFLAPADADGLKADFHSLRHTMISFLAAAGVHPSIAQRLARHASITLTMDRYTHVHGTDLAAALNCLPTITGTPAGQEIRATGTFDAVAITDRAVENRQNSLSAGLSLEGGNGLNPVETSGVNTDPTAQAKTPEIPAVSCGFQGFSLSEGDGARTRNHRIDSPVL